MENAATVSGMEWASSLIQQTLISIDQVRSSEVNAVFRLVYDQGASVFLKLGSNLEPEYERLCWIVGRLPCPQPLGFTKFGAVNALLVSAVQGEDLAQLAAQLPPEKTIRQLASVLKRLHATNTDNFPFNKKAGKTLVHGDACLPNFIFHDNSLTGYIDVGDMRLDDPEVDLSAGVWSLEHNLGSGYGLCFLREYGIDNASEADVERLWRMYAEGG